MYVRTNVYIRSGCSRCIAPDFLQSKSSHVRFALKNIHPLHHGASFYPWLVSFCLQIAGENLQMGVDKLVGKVSINILLHVKLAACVIIDALAVVKCSMYINDWVHVNQYLHNTSTHY